MSKRYQAAILTASYNGLKVPNAPTIGTATSGGLSASVTFTAPSNIGGGAITSYTAISSPGGLTGSSASSPVTVSGLTAGVSYTFTVVANNVYGASPASAASNSITAVDPSAFIENLFSTYLYTGNGSTQTITNGIDLTTYGGLVWSKCRSSDLGGNGIHTLIDTVRGAGYRISSELTGAQVYNDNTVTGFSSTGFSIGNSPINNTSSATFVSWTFRKQAKFFDVVTYTGAGSGTTVSHNLGSTPGCVIVKATSGVDGWFVYHRDLLSAPPTNRYLRLDKTDATAFLSNWISVSDTTITFPTAYGPTASGGTSYVAYLFAHNAGGFGTSGTDNVISCGSVTADGSGNATVNLGYEPQWILVKSSSEANGWAIVDTMRGLPADGLDRFLFANNSNAESGGGLVNINATGFYANATLSASATYIYIAIRRGPMAVPTSGASVYTTRVATEVEYNNTADFGITTDLLLNRYYKDGSQYTMSFDRLRGSSKILYTPLTDAEGSLTLGAGNLGFGAAQTSVTWAQIANSSVSNVTWAFKRAPSFFDEVCYTGTGNVGSDATRITHNLGVAPELIIVKGRTNAVGWPTYTATGGVNSLLLVNATDASSAITGIWATTSPTSTTFGVSNGGGTYNNGGGVNYVAYLFATCAGVSKVGSYTGTGALQTVNCGFAAGARFVLIKRTDSTGDWYTYDSARGITSSNDPYLFLNSTAAEVTNTNYVDTDVTGFKITAAAPAGLNAAGGTYIFLAIA